jgi:hypothetical protein
MLHRLRVQTVACLLAILVPVASSAATADLLIGDQEFIDASAMSLAEVQTFLQEHGSPLATSFLPDSDGHLKLPTEIIWFAAQEARINPKVLLTTLQKEQRAITDPKPSQRQLDFVMGYGCPDGSGCSDRFRGFGKQVRGAALQFRGYLDDLREKGETIARWAVGRAKVTGDGVEVAPQNAATAALYSYTPWRGGTANVRRVGGNLSFVRIWNQWFGKGAWPDGTVLETPDGFRWLLQSSKRRKLATPAVAAIRSANVAVVTAGQEEVEAYPEGVPIRLPDYTVVEDPLGMRWLLVGDTRRKIASREVFRKLGFHPEEIESLTTDELAAYTEGPAITKAAQDPRGTLVLERETKKAWLIIGDTKYAVLDPFIQRVAVGDDLPLKRAAKEIKKLKTGAPLRLPEGAIVTASKHLPKAFIISNGKRRPFVSPRSLELLGYQWSDVRHVTNAALELHALGDPITDNGMETQAPAPAPAPAPPPVVRRYVSGLSIF